MRAGDVALLLDGVAVGDAVGRRAGRQHHLDLRHRGGVEGGAERGEEGENLRRRVGLHRIEDAAVGQRAREGLEIAADDVEVDDKAGAVGSSLVEERADAVRHHRAEIPNPSVAARGVLRRSSARDGDGRDTPGSPQPAKSRVVRAERLLGTDEGPTCEPSLGTGRSRSARPAMRVCASSVSPAFGGPTETKKARHRRCFKPPFKNPGDHRHVRIWASAHVCASRPAMQEKM